MNHKVKENTTGTATSTGASPSLYRVSVSGSVVCRRVDGGNVRETSEGNSGGSKCHKLIDGLRINSTRHANYRHNVYVRPSQLPSLSLCL